MAKKVKFNYDELSIDEKISMEIDRLNSIFDNIAEDKKSLCSQLIQNAAFMAISLKELQEDMNKKGMVEEYQNGPNQSGTRISPSAQIYTKMIANYNAVIKQLIALLPSSDKLPAKTATDPMALFLGSK